MAKRVKGVKPSSSQASAATRRKVFVERYLVNGNNATEAGIFAGFSPKTAYSTGQRLLKHPATQALLGNRAEELLTDAKLSTERWAKEMACIGHLDPRELYDASGNLIQIHLLPEHVARAIASVKQGVKGETTVTMVDKNTALANIGKHLGVFERDNLQKVEPIHVTVTLVGKINGPASRADITGKARVLDGSTPV